METVTFFPSHPHLLLALMSSGVFVYSNTIMLLLLIWAVLGFEWKSHMWSVDLYKKHFQTVVPFFKKKISPNISFFKKKNKKMNLGYDVQIVTGNILFFPNSVLYTAPKGCVGFVLFK